MRQKQTIGLMQFLRGSTNVELKMPGCACYYEGACIFDEPCKVQNGKRCKYFERCVLPTAADMGLNTCVYRKYEKLMKARLKKKKVRHCVCGREMQKHRRYCDLCREQRRKKSNRRKKC